MTPVLLAAARLSPSTTVGVVIYAIAILILAGTIIRLVCWPLPPMPDVEEEAHLAFLARRAAGPECAGDDAEGA